MADILIRGMEMPERSDVIVQIFSDGKAVLYPFLGEPRAVEAVELPPHGDLIDRSEALSMPFANGKYDHENANEHFIYGCETYKEWLEQLPVIIPASEEVIE